MASKSPKKAPGDGGPNMKVLLAAMGIAVISSVSSFVAIRFAMPKQVIIEKHIVTEKGKIVEDKHEEKKPEAAPEAYPIGEFIVNLSEPGRRYLKTSVTLLVAGEAPADGKKKAEGGHEGGGDGANAAIKAEMAPYEALYKDTIITTLSRQTIARLQAPGGWAMVKDELKVALNRAVPDKKVVGVLFTDFIIQ
ncbi:MAG TPA: flagellar basal body-associated FliL family protein [Stenomitos sp.]